MSNKTLYNKYRPNSLDQIKGNKETVAYLKSKIGTGGISHTILFSGPRGCGKTTTARIIARQIGCSEIDITEMNCANDTGVDITREIIRTMRNKPLAGKARAWIMDEVHCLTGNAQSNLLKPLEEPPEHVYFFLCTTDPQKLKNTIRSRCTELSVQPLTELQLTVLMKGICKKERKRVPTEVLKQIAQDSLGHPRDALSILDKIIDLDPREMESVARRAAEQQNAVIDLCRSLWKKRPWKEITGIITNLKEDPENTRRSVLGYCDSILAKADEPWAYIIMSCFRESFFYTGKPGLRLACYEALEEIKDIK